MRRQRPQNQCRSERGTAFAIIGNSD